MSRTLRVDDIARHHLARRELLFFVWVTLTERKWVILAERRSGRGLAKLVGRAAWAGMV